MMLWKFVFVCLCLGVAVASFRWRHSLRDWAWLVGGLAATVAADFFLVLHDAHLPGVAVFCLAHICYMHRTGAPWRYHQRLARGLESPRAVSWKVAAHIVILLMIIGTLYMLGELMLLVGLYAALFATNLGMNIWWVLQDDHNDKALPPKRNRALVLVGLVLFMLCDVHVLLFNLPYYMEVPTMPWAFTLIWVFYLPSQALLAVSGASRAWRF